MSSFFFFFSIIRCCFTEAFDLGYSLSVYSTFRGFSEVICQFNVIKPLCCHSFDVAKMLDSWLRINGKFLNVSVEKVNKIEIF